MCSFSFFCQFLLVVLFGFDWHLFWVSRFPAWLDFGVCMLFFHVFTFVFCTCTPFLCWVFFLIYVYFWMLSAWKCIHASTTCTNYIRVRKLHSYIFILHIIKSAFFVLIMWIFLLSHFPYSLRVITMLILLLIKYIFYYYLYVRMKVQYNICVNYTRLLKLHYYMCIRCIL